MATNRRDAFNHIHVSMPHSGVLCPGEIPLESLSGKQAELASNVDWHTDRLYDFRDLLGNSQTVFPFSQVYINVNRHPDALDACVPDSIDGVPVYRRGKRLSLNFKRMLVRKYHDAYHAAIKGSRKSFILDGHSTVTGHADAGGNEVCDDIIISDRQQTPWDPPGGIRTAPDGLMEIYAEELARQLGSGIRVGCNTTYCDTYGHVMACHGWDGIQPRNGRVPLLLQETNEHLYIKGSVLDVLALEVLRRAFAVSLSRMVQKMGRRLNF